MAQPSIWGDALDGFQNAVANPLTLGGLSLLSGGGLSEGINAGNVLQKQRLQQRQQQAVQAGIMGMPNLNDNDRQILGNSPDLANSVLENIYKSRFDPMAGLDKQYKQAQIRHLDAESADSGSAYGKTGTVVQGSDGKYYSIQFGSRGQRQILPLELGGGASSAGPQTGSPAQPGLPPAASAPPVSLAPQRGVDVVGDQMYDKATGRPVRDVSGNIAGGEAAKVTGRETAQGQMNLPKSQIALEQSKIENDVVTDSIDQAIKQADAYTAGFTGSVTSRIPGTKAYDLGNTLNTVKANLGFDKLQDMRNNSPTGGALGQVSEMETRLLQSTWGSVEQSQSPVQLKTNLGKIKAIRQKYQALKQQAYDIDVKRFGKSAVPDLKTGKLPGQADSQAAGATAQSTPDADPRTVPAGQTFTYRGHMLKALGNGQFEAVQ